ncbi:NAD-dependent epimerase/dehydratase family protein [uncultured Sneathiella sp.]|uniref:NAD-dependent epimerase/dehydratase family protein n=1 Tax=uncultured Sneathiella sp. TaxID=879315 RepID=UPI0030EB2260|tara:strand:- start:3046 stop:4149 length:1104 start_codon:yes stop_codon:yes gene_type:complete
MKALLIGGTGPTGRYLINGLLERGYEVAMLNRGGRDDSHIPAEVERIKADPHFKESLASTLEGRRFDVVIGAYGRIKIVSDVLAPLTRRLITIGGMAIFRGFADPKSVFPTGCTVPLGETTPLLRSPEDHVFGYKMLDAERHVMSHHGKDCNVSHFRYPLIYGAGQVMPIRFWWFIQRALDKRKRVAMPDGGLTIISNGYAENMAHAVLLGVDKPEAAAGKVYNCADQRQFTLAQLGEVLFEAMGEKLEIVSIPDAVASHARVLQVFNDEDFHRMFDIFPLQRDLGYRDVVDPIDGSRQTVRWYQENPPADSLAEEVRAQYAIEDALITLQDEALEKMARLDHNEPEYFHGYAHPKKMGETRDHRGR